MLEGELRLDYRPRNKMHADILSKPLEGRRFVMLMNYIFSLKDQIWFASVLRSETTNCTADRSMEELPPYDCSIQALVYAHEEFHVLSRSIVYTFLKSIQYGYFKEDVLLSYDIL